MISAYVHPYSNLLHMETDVRLLMPDLSEEERPLPIVYLCHGGSGDEDAWLYYGNISQLCDLYRVAFCLVNVQDSCFTDMAHGFSYASFVGKELPPLMCQLFPRLSGRREDTFISGYSNGGYGCLLIGFTFPEAFAAIGAFSAGDKADDSLKDVPNPLRPGKMDPRIRMYGTTKLHGTRYSVAHLASVCAASEGYKPRVYHACGGKDPWLSMNRIVKHHMEDLACPAFDYRYEQMEEYGHEWPFWSLALEHFLVYAGLSGNSD